MPSRTNHWRELDRLATIREYFDSDTKLMTIHKDWLLSGSLATTVIAKIAWDSDANARYWSFFVPDHPQITTIISSILSSKETKHCFLFENGDNAQVLAGFSEYPPMLSSSSLKFTGRVFFYVNADLGLAGRLTVENEGERMGYNAVVRDREYAALRSSFEKPLAFISHDSRDKESLVRQLAIEMFKALYPVWYDEYSLKVGDSLRDNIERAVGS